MTNKKKVVIIGSAGLPAKYGGFETMVNYLTKEKNNEIEFTVFCQKTSKEHKITEFNGSKLVYLPFNANGAQSIIYDVSSIIKSWFKYDVLLILGTPGCIIIPFLNFFKKSKTIINFGGLEWKRQKWNIFIRKYLKFTEAIAVNNSTIIVADNKYFCDYIKEEYKRNAILIEYGGDHTSQLAISANFNKKYPFLDNEYAISVSRAQPDNNLHILLEAFSEMPNKTFVLISNWDKFKYGKDLKKKFSNYSNLFLVDAIYDLEILDVIRSNAKLYIHSHKFCGTAPSLVEAMNLGLPIIAYDVPTNIETTENKALFFKTPKELISLIDETSNTTLEKLGLEMKKIASRRYSWSEISNKYVELFNY
jgi:glycosyltransferase involved in cell wall biosynthesis